MRAKPVQFFGGDGVVRGVARIDVGLAQQFEAATAKPVASRPCRDEFWRDILRLAAQEIEPVRLWGVQTHCEERAMI